MNTSKHPTGNPTRGEPITASAPVARKTAPRAPGEAMLLEPRIVFDAALLVSVVEVVPEMPQDKAPVAAEPAPAEAAPAEVPATGEQEEAEEAEEAAADESAVDPAADEETVERPTAPAEQTSVVFVDAAAVDLLETMDLASSEVRVLDAGADGVEQIANHLQGRTGVEAIHILSHGSDGQLALGNGLLNLSTLQSDYADEFATIRAALSPEADLLIYGCDVASTEEGLAFVAALAEATGADVAASTDDTGALALGGDWELEHQVGRLEAGALSAEDWHGLLATTVPSQNLDFSDIATLNGTTFTGAVTVVAGDVVRLVDVLTIDGQSVDLLLTVLSIANVNGNTTISEVGSVEILASPSLDPQVEVQLSFVLGGTDTLYALPSTGQFVIQDVDSQDGIDMTEVVGLQSGGFGSVVAGSDLASGGFANSVDPAGYDFYRMDPAVAGDVNNWVDEVNVFGNPATNTLTASTAAGFSTARFVYGATGTEAGQMPRAIHLGSFVLDSFVTNDVPVDGDETNTVTEDTTLAVADGATGDLLANSSDGDGDALTITQFVVDGDATVYSAGSTATIAGVGALTIHGNGSYSFTPAANYTGAVPVATYTVSDGSGGTDTSTLELSITPAAQPDAPPTASTAEDTPLVFSGANGNAISITDPGHTNAVVEVTLEIPSGIGTLQLSGTAGLDSVSGNGSHQIILTGTIDTVNAAINGLTLTPTADYNSATTADLQVTVHRVLDLGFVNGGFENPDFADLDAFHALNESLVPGWDTSASDNTIEIWDSGHTGVEAFEGDQFAELNANQVSTLSQTFTPSITGGDLELSFAHRGRSGDDTMNVTATDLGADGVLGGGDDTVLFSQNYTTGNTAWQQYSADLGPATGNAVVLQFNSVSAAGGDPSFGNFLDAINITGSSSPTTDVVQVAITPVQDTVTDHISTHEDTPVTFNVLTGTGGASADHFEGTPTVTGHTSPGHGTLVVGSNGEVTYTPHPDYTGTDSFTYTVTSPTGVTETEVVHITVTGSDPTQPAPAPRPAPEPPAPAPRPEVPRPADPSPTRDGVPAPAASPSTPALLPTPPQLHVLVAVAESSAERALSATPLGTLSTGAPLLGEAMAQLPDSLLFADNERGDHIGLVREPVYGALQAPSPALYVQHAVRHQPISTDPSLWVQHAVRASQLESRLRAATLDANNSATPGFGTLADQFALGAPQTEGSVTQLAQAQLREQGQEPVAKVAAEPVAPEPPVKEPVKAAEKPLDKPQAAKGLRQQLQRFAKDRAVSARPITRAAVSG
jgi:hypothetical protein